ncbi:lantibiotic immunity ABC transporter MutE/EpiE family permease subunit [Ktedonosporobacter rubrisoli]|uniref:Lantibiotic immunity ABC transporter MutE/EpiE family permease subunit n=1 Tax=Ktedonosporobacter rubrisoli TaxID=2509675 RepID=A0A4P6JLE2_KTERU|nr:lantibiotic immunity ABC transporter MutE/EpiE family permease subunit [Ktedonosporobacter rubrisoli]QBD75893.1 lantibiotic immunity ABC transporter MutE/EpiE family permease subunit [Ktedonosporobacter rubrisoli]
MLGVVLSEWLRLKRTSAFWLVGILPLSLVLLSFVLRFLSSNVDTWNIYIWTTFNWWSLFWLPLGIALLAAQTTVLEARAGSWKALRARAIKPAWLYAGKLCVLVVHTFISALLLLLLCLLVGAPTLHSAIPWQALLGGSLLTWIAALPLVALMLLCGTLGGYAMTALITLIFSMIGAMAAEQSYWFLVPWAWPLRVAIPLVGVHPNGIPLEKTDPLWHLPILPIIALALLCFVLFAALGMLWFERREVR